MATQTDMVDGTSRVLVLGKVVQILDAFTPEAPELSLSEVTVRTGLPTSTCLRLTRNLVHDGLLERNGDRYRIGLRIVHWASAALEGRTVIKLAQQYLDALRDDTGESALLSIRDGLLRVAVAVAASKNVIRREVLVGETQPLYVGSSGRIFLAFDEVRINQAAPLSALTDVTITDHVELDRTLERARQTGYTVSGGERNEGAMGISAPVYNEHGRMCAALGIVGPIERIRHFGEQAAAQKVMAAAAALSASLKGVVPDAKRTTAKFEDR